MRNKSCVPGIPELSYEMISEKTVFILGAGASQPYRFPVGVELNKRIYEWVTSTKGLKDLQKQFLLKQTSEIKRMATSLLRAEVSIDVWLAQNLQYSEVGKFCIGKFICETENSETLFNGEWYADLFRRLLPPELPGGPGKVEDLNKNDVTFVTFNYDRSLEQALWMKARALFPTKPEMCDDVISNLQIIHLHGQVGRLPWQKENKFLEGTTIRDYKPDFKVGGLFLNSGIKVIAETERDTPEYAEARAKLLEAKRIHFLGVGYDPINLSRLKFGTGRSKAPISGTHLGLPLPRKKLLESDGAEFEMPITFEGMPATITEYFRQIV